MPIDPQANAGYMIAAYVITAVVLVGYAIGLWRRVAAGKREERSGKS